MVARAEEVSMLDARYQQVLAALARPQAYPHPAASIEHLQTHISDVFLAGDYAYKLKKPIDLGFLDFTTLERRRQACDDEVRLNRRLAPQIYLGVMAVCEHDGQYRLAADCGAQAVADYAVQMVQLPQAGLLDRVAARGELTREHASAIAHEVATFHAHAERGPAIDALATAQAIAYPVMQNFQQTERYIGQTITSEQFDRLRDYATAFLDHNAALFEARIRDGHVVDGHGDLHLRNMALYCGDVVIFDCIEFNQAFRAGDVMNDIAFLTMDLDARGLPALGNRFLNDYLERTDDYAGLRVFDFYQVYRAYVRGKVTSFLLDGDASDCEKDRAVTNARAYFALAGRYLDPRLPGVLITSGLSGSGKTTAARQAAEYLGGVIVRSDAVRKHLAGLSPQTRATAAFGEGIYTAGLSAQTYAQMLARAEDVIASGRWAILDATFGQRSQREAAADFARHHRVPFALLACTAPRAELERRLHERAAQGKDASDANVAILDEQARRYEAPMAEEGRLFVWDGHQDAARVLRPLRAAGRSSAVRN
jgi:hypothetical protein